MSDWTEDQLIDNIRTGESAAIKHLYISVFEKVRALIESNNGGYQDAQDVFQESIVDLIDNLNQGKFLGNSKLSTYLVSIAKYKWLGEIRKKGKTGKVVDIEQQRKIDKGEDEVKVRENLSLKDQREQVALAYANELSKECWEILKGFYFEQKPLRDLAQDLNYKEGFIRIKKMRCLEALRKKLKENALFKEA